MRKLKRRLATLSAFIVLASGYFATEPHYEDCQFEILEDDEDAFARCSAGTVYIGDKAFLSSIPEGEGIILIEDQRVPKTGHDPNMKIYDSCSIDSRVERNEILEILMEYERRYPTGWDRSIESMRLEWLMHNLSYQFSYQRDRTADVDLNNDDEEKYDSKVLQKLFRVE